MTSDGRRDFQKKGLEALVCRTNHALKTFGVTTEKY